MRQVLRSGLGVFCAAGAFLAGMGLVRAADSSAADAGAVSAAPAQAPSQDAGTASASPAPEAAKDAGASEPAAADAGKAEPAAAKEAAPAKAEAAPPQSPAPPPAVEVRPKPPAAEVAKPPKKDLGLMIGGSAAALAGAAAMGVGIYYLHVDGQPVCRAGESAPCDFERDTRTFGDVMLASGSGVFLLGAAVFFWGFYSDDTGVAVAPTGMVVRGRF